jgi:predicted RNase H-like HicB family nuclease
MSVEAAAKDGERLAQGSGCARIASMNRKESVSAAARSYTVLLQPEPEGGYTVTCPTLPGLVTYGATLEEARAMAADAIEGYIECLREDGEPIPESDPAPAPLVDRVSVKAR